MIYVLCHMYSAYLSQDCNCGPVVICSQFCLKKRVGDIEGAAGKFMGKHRGHRSISLHFFYGFVLFYNIFYIFYIIINFIAYLSCKWVRKLSG